jgi:hypothetical protein
MALSSSAVAHCTPAPVRVGKGESERNLGVSRCVNSALPPDPKRRAPAALSRRCVAQQRGQRFSSAPRPALPPFALVISGHFRRSGEGGFWTACRPLPTGSRHGHRRQHHVRERRGCPRGQRQQRGAALAPPQRGTAPAAAAPRRCCARAPLRSREQPRGAARGGAARALRVFKAAAAHARKQAAPRALP